MLFVSSFRNFRLSALWKELLGDYLDVHFCQIDDPEVGEGFKQNRGQCFRHCVPFPKYGCHVFDWLRVSDDDTVPVDDAWQIIADDAFVTNAAATTNLDGRCMTHEGQYR